MEVDPRVAAATTPDDDDSDQTYRGFFTVHRSADFMLKICFTLLVFVLILVFTSLHITRKKYRLPNLFRAARLRRPLELFKLDALAPPLPALKANEALAVGCPSGWLLMHRISLHDVKLPIQPFSCAPEWLREESFGLLFSCASPERRILTHLVDYAFHDLPSNRIETVIRSEVMSLLSENLNLIGNFEFDSIARRVALVLVLNLTDSGDAGDRATIRGLRHCVDELRAMHYGTRTLSLWERFSPLFGAHSSARTALVDVKRLLEFPIREEMDNAHASTVDAPNFLQTFIAARLDLEEEGDQTSFLTVAHLAHAAADCLVLLEEVLVPAYRWSLLILGHRDELAEALREEESSLGGRVGPRARAFALELVRWSQIGWQLSCMQLLDDWGGAQFDFPMRSVLMFDMKSVARDPLLWSEPDSFQPERFRVRHEPGTGWVARVDGSVAPVELLLEASGWGSFVPIEFLLHSIAAGAAAIATCLKVKVEGNEELKMAPHSTSRMPVPFHFVIRGREES